MSPLLKTEEVLALLRVSRPTLRRLIASGEVPAVRLGSTWRFDPERIRGITGR